MMYACPEHGKENSFQLNFKKEVKDKSLRNGEGGVRKTRTLAVLLICD